MSSDQRPGHRIFAAFYEWSSKRSDRGALGPRRARLVGDLTGEVLEVGAGNGLNLAYYRGVSRVVVVEPDPHMLGRLRRRAAQASFPVTIEQVGAENLPFPNEMFDAAVTSMALCTIPDATAALAEMRRVLKPGGQLRFMEHVRGTDLRGPIFDVIAPVWSYLSGGCQPNRNTETSIESAGFTITSIERGSFGLLPYIQGVAVKSN